MQKSIPIILCIVFAIYLIILKKENSDLSEDLSKAKSTIEKQNKELENYTVDMMLVDIADNALECRHVARNREDILYSSIDHHAQKILTLKKGSYDEELLLLAKRALADYYVNSKREPTKELKEFIKDDLEYMTKKYLVKPLIDEGRKRDRMLDRQKN